METVQILIRVLITYSLKKLSLVEICKEILAEQDVIVRWKVRNQEIYQQAHFFLSECSQYLIA